MRNKSGWISVNLDIVENKESIIVFGQFLEKRKRRNADSVQVSVHA